MELPLFVDFCCCCFGSMVSVVFECLLPACFLLVSCLTFFLTLKMEAICSSETWLTYPTLHGVNIPEDSPGDNHSS
jgi:hypothetical protein